MTFESYYVTVFSRTGVGEELTDPTVIMADDKRYRVQSPIQLYQPHLSQKTLFCLT